MKLVGFAGRKGSGKDTAAGALVDYEIVKFAGGLKTMLRAYLAYVGVDEVTIERMIEGDLKEEPSEYFCGKSTRYAQQTLGTEWGRNLIGEEIWINAFEFRAKMFLCVANTDMRFANEVQRVIDLGGTTFRIFDPHFVKPDEEHASEAEIDNLPVEHVIKNDKKTMSILDLHDQVRAKMGELP